MSDQVANDNAAAIWQGLSEGERWTLQNINEHIDVAIWENLVNKGLVSTELESGKGYVTPLGRDVLAVSAPAPVVGAAGAEKPATITAYTFFDENYERNIREGLCKVIFDGKEYKEFIGKSLGNTMLGTGDSLYTFRDSQKLQVHWLPQAATPPAAASGGDEAPLLAEVYHCIDDEMLKMLRGYGVSRHDTEVLDSQLWRDHQASVQYHLQQAQTDLTTLRLELAASADEQARMRTALEEIAKPIIKDRSAQYRATHRRFLAKNALIDPALAKGTPDAK